MRQLCRSRENEKLLGSWCNLVKGTQYFLLYSRNLLSVVLCDPVSLAFNVKFLPHDMRNFHMNYHIRPPTRHRLGIKVKDLMPFFYPHLCPMPPPSLFNGEMRGSERAAERERGERWTTKSDAPALRREIRHCSTLAPVDRPCRRWQRWGGRGFDGIQGLRWCKIFIFPMVSKNVVPPMMFII